MQDNGNSKKANRQNKNPAAEAKTDAAYNTFALAGGKRNPNSGTTIPSEDGVEEARKFVEENKK